MYLNCGGCCYSSSFRDVVMVEEHKHGCNLEDVLITSVTDYSFSAVFLNLFKYVVHSN